MNDLRTHKRRRLGGFTLVETLAVVMLLGLIFSVAIVSLSAADRAGAMHEAIWRYSNLDAQGRLMARTNGCGSVIRTLDEGRRLQLAEIGSDSTFIEQSDLPAGIRVRLLAVEAGATRGLTALFIERRGRSADAIVELRAEDQSARQWLIRGLSGQITRIEPGPESAP